MQTSKKRRATKSSKEHRVAGDSEMDANAENAEIVAPGTTGRYLILMREDAVKAGVKALSETAGLKVASTADYEDGGVEADQLAGADAILFEDLGVVVVDTPPEQIRAI